MNLPRPPTLAYGMAAAVGLGSLVACTTMAPVPKPLQYVNNRTPVEVWVIRRHHDSLFRVSQPRLQGDTLIGFVLPQAGSNGLTQYQEIPLGDVRQMRAKQPAKVRTGALVAGAVGLAVFTWTTFVHGSNGQRLLPGSDPNCDCDFDSICGC